MGRGSTGKNPIQIAVFGRHSGGARCRNIHLHSPMLRLRGCRDRMHLRGLAKCSQGSSTTSRRGLGSGCDYRFRFAEMATATVHRISGHRDWRESDRLQERDGRRQEAEWNSCESAQCQRIQTTAEYGIQGLNER